MQFTRPIIVQYVPVVVSLIKLLLLLSYWSIGPETELIDPEEKDKKHILIDWLEIGNERNCGNQNHISSQNLITGHWQLWVTQIKGRVAILSADNCEWPNFGSKQRSANAVSLWFLSLAALRWLIIGDRRTDPHVLQPYPHIWALQSFKSYHGWWMGKVASLPNIKWQGWAWDIFEDSQKSGCVLTFGLLPTNWPQISWATLDLEVFQCAVTVIPNSPPSLGH